jgi:hypothetical protein
LLENHAIVMTMKRELLIKILSPQQVQDRRMLRKGVR